MSRLQYFVYPDQGLLLREKHSYNQAVRVGDRIECAGSWDPITGDMKTDLDEEIDQAFDNVNLALKDAGGKGWNQVFRINSYHTDMSYDALMHMIKNIRERMPDYQPLWTTVGVAKLTLEGMRVEIEVSAFDEEVAEEARKARAAAVKQE
ncbi:L-PSP endoribonuclease family protein [Patellaria atrata CBS 101060]|uniref:L-PSP endoribonuclease family protein n=1 Tax=Patellaria atrata CBS 101060 TaxID=1346257 RepID=A0A9P4SCH0_9PEZI|nr:L-PSP endoribonuclease family protein [Patellaria atrata CBS 101060]